MSLPRLKWSIVLSFVILIIITTNFIDQNNYDRVKKSMNTIYNDRLVVNDIIFELNLILQKKEMAVIENDSLFFEQQNPKLNQEITGLLKRFNETVLVPKEAKQLNAFETNLETLYRLESVDFNHNENAIELQQQLNRMESTLHKLSKIQLEEGRRQLFLGKKAVASIDLYTKMEVFLLIILAILLLFTIFYRPKPNSNSAEN
jgi:hypothetical protein